jgi:hypothetical protein
MMAWRDKMPKKTELRFFELLKKGVFSIDDEGRVWRHIILFGGNQSQKAKPKIIDPPRRAETLKTLYPVISFHYDGAVQHVYAHRVVWEYHNKMLIPEGMQTNHKDGNKHNNHPSNLEVITHQENLDHAVRTGLIPRRFVKGEKHVYAKLKRKQVLEIRRLYSEGNHSQSELGRMYGVCRETISSITRHINWTHI